MESFRFGVTILFTILLAELTRSAEISKVLRAAPARALDGVEGPDYQGYDDYLDEDDSGAKDEEAMMSADPTLGDCIAWSLGVLICYLSVGDGIGSRLHRWDDFGCWRSPCSTSMFQ